MLHKVMPVDGQAGSVTLTNHMIEDPTLTVVNMARGSLGKRVEEVGTGDLNLVDRLAEENHMSPFRHSPITLHVKCPIFVKNQWIKHQVGATMAFVDTPWNEISGRYVVFGKEDIWVPEELHEQARISKSGGTNTVLENSDTLIGEYLQSVQASYNAYHYLIMQKVAREEARALLPLALYTQFYWTPSEQALANFITLRTAPDAQRHIRAYAEVVNTICETHYGYSWKALIG
jgi:thymidylate synthase (FAD)